MAHYRIEMTLKGKDQPMCLQYATWTGVMAAWDNAVEDALPGDKLRLIDLESGKVRSVYAPVDREALYDDLEAD